MDEANAFLPGFPTKFHGRFAVPAAESKSAYRPLPGAFDPDRVVCFKYQRVVRPDSTITFGSRVLQIHPSAERASWARARVEVHESLDNTLAVYDRTRSCSPTQRRPLLPPCAPAPVHGPKPLGHEFLTLQPPRPPISRSRARAPGKPGPNLPWRRSMVSPSHPSHPQGSQNRCTVQMTNSLFSNTAVRASANRC